MLLCVLFKAMRRVDDLLPDDSPERPSYAVETVPSIKSSKMSQEASDPEKYRYHKQVMDASRDVLKRMAEAHGNPLSELHDFLPGHYDEKDESGNEVSTKNPMTRIFAGFKRRRHGGTLSPDELDDLHEFAGAVAHGFNQDSVGYMVPNKISDPEDGNGTFWHMGRPMNREDMNWLQDELGNSPHKGTAVIADPKGMHTLDWGERGEHQPFREWLAKKFDEKYGEDNDFSYEPFRDDGGLSFRKEYAPNGDRIAGQSYPSGKEPDEKGNTARRGKSSVWQYVPQLQRAIATAYAARGGSSTVRPETGERRGVVVVKGFRSRLEKPRTYVAVLQRGGRHGSDVRDRASHSVVAIVARRNGAVEPS